MPFRLFPHTMQQRLHILVITSHKTFIMQQNFYFLCFFPNIDRPKPKDYHIQELSLQSIIYYH